MGLGDRVIEIEDASATTLPGRALAFLDDIETIRGPLLREVLAQHRSAMSVAEELRALRG
jgi:hypothetical protein